MISVIICTHNRAPLLARAIESLAAQARPVPTEIVVVDNCSTDTTQRVVQQLSDRYPGLIRYVMEERLGLSHARNAGMRAAQGDIVAFIDDDVILCAGWLEELARAFHTHPEAACVCGPAEPEWCAPPPSWMTPELVAFVAPGDYGPAAKALRGKQYPAGLNMAFRRESIAELGEFSSSLGHVGTSLLGVEEVDFVDRLRRGGGEVLYVPLVRVRHLVPCERMTREYFLERRRGDGRSIARWEWARSSWLVLLVRAFLRATWVIPRDLAGWLVTLVVGPQEHAFTYTCRLAKTLAYLQEAFLLLMTGIREDCSQAVSRGAHRTNDAALQTLSSAAPSVPRIVSPPKE